jgi:glycosyltransferase involved in cell wall biosynthesis
LPAILHLIPTLEGGGAERQLVLLACEQARDGDSVHIGLRRRGVHAEAAERGGVTIHELGDYASLDPRLILSILRLLRRLRPGIVQTWLPQADVCGGVAALFARVRWVMTERASAAAHEPLGLLHRARRWLARRADAIVANSHNGLEYWAGVEARSGAARIIPNAVDLQSIQNAAMGGDPGCSAADALVLSVGRLVASKGHEVVLAAWTDPKLAQVRLYLIGDGPERDTLQARVERDGLQERVSLMPFRADWWSLLGSARALVSLSRHEGAPNVVLEAMAAGVPLIVSDIAAHRHILDEASALFVAPDDADGLARAVRACLDQPEASLARARAATRRVEAMSVRANADAYRETYELIQQERR